MTPRQQRALEIVSSGALDTLVAVDLSPAGGAPEHYLVPSNRCEGAFYVTSTHECTCPDAKFSNVTCKHQVAIRLQRVLDACKESTS